MACPREGVDVSRWVSENHVKLASFGAILATLFNPHIWQLLDMLVSSFLLHSCEG